MVEDDNRQKKKDILVTTKDARKDISEITQRTGLSEEQAIHRSIDFLRLQDEEDLREKILKDLQKSSPEKRKNFNTWIAGILALSLWSMLGITLVWNLASISTVYIYLLNQPSSSSVELEKESDLEKFDKSFSMINDTSKSLYAVIVPIAATVTAFYFDAKRKEQEKMEKS